MQWLRELLKSSYTRRLEEENARLLQENRAMLNALLGAGGFKPVEFPEAPVRNEVKHRRRLSWHQAQVENERKSEQRIVARAAAMSSNVQTKG